MDRVLWCRWDGSIIHPLNDNWMMGSVQYGGRMRTKDGGLTNHGSSPSGQSGSSNAAWEAPLTYDPNDHMKIYHFSDSVFVSEDFGTNWSYKGKPISFQSNIHQSAIAENNSDIMVISNYEFIDKSMDGGAIFTSIKNGLPNSSIMDIAFDPNDDNVIIVVYATHANDGQKVYITYDGGSTWINITYNLGDMPIHTVVIDHTNESNIYLGAEIGAYTKPMNATTWTLFNTDLPNTTVEELEIVNGSNTLKAATWGRGLWETKLTGRSDYPSIVHTSLTNNPSEVDPKIGMDQYVTSVVISSNTISTVYIKWSANSPTFVNTIGMLNTQDSTWVSQTPLPDYPVGTKVYFKVIAVGSANDTTETYKFMYTLLPFEYCTSSGTMTYQGNITQVDLNDIGNSSGKTQPYTDYTSTVSTNLKRNNTYDLSVKLNTDNGNHTYYAKAWIDWNQDADFEDDNESYELGTTTNMTNGATSLSPLPITVPSDAVLGTTRMRVSCLYDSYPSTCNQGFDGEVEDYGIVVESCGSVNTGIITNGTTLTAGASNASYQWLDCDDNYAFIIGATTQAYTPTVNGNYAVLVTENNCIDTSDCYLISVVSVIENTFEVLPNLFPNPTTGEIQLEFGSLQSIVVVRITNTMGQLVFTNTYSTISKIDLDIAGTSGIYFLDITNQEGAIAKLRVIKQ